MNFIPSSSASWRPCSSVTTRLSVQSDLFPISILLTPSAACCSMFECQLRISEPSIVKYFYNLKIVRPTIKRTFIGDIVDEKNSHCTAIISGCYRTEAFLASSIPLQRLLDVQMQDAQSYDLQLDTLAIELYGPNFEVDSNSRDERRCPCIITEAQQKTGLADTWQ
jgi:hypothetical protein